MKKCLIVILAMILLVGCSNRKKPTGSSVVSQITVTYQENGNQIVKSYTSQYKMRQVLDRFRLLGQKYSPVIDPDTLRSTVFEVRLSFANGTQRLYHTRSDRYIRTDNGPWQQTDPLRMQELNELLLQLPPDIWGPLKTPFRQNGGSFAPNFAFKNLERHPVFLRFLTQNL